MIFTMPSSLKDFKCKAGDCKASCCIGWEIDIDSDTADLYRNTGGKFGTRLSENISFGEPSCFILDKNERCPFLNSKNLCDIIINLGEEHLCQICRDHPRYFEWYDGLKEGGIGLCCELAAEMIISSEDTSFVSTQTEDESCSDYDHDLFDLMYSARSIMMETAVRKDISAAQKISSVLDFCEILQYNADNNNFSVPELIISSPESTADIRKIFEYLNGLEHINTEWPLKLKNLYENAEITAEYIKSNSMPEKYELYAGNIFCYFIWRHFLKGVFDGEFLSRIKLAAVSTAVISNMFIQLCINGNFNTENCACAAKDYSKEIEYCEENLEAFFDDSYELDILTSENIKGLFN